jgi:hypothetical protein
VVITNTHHKSIAYYMIDLCIRGNYPRPPLCSAQHYTQHGGFSLRLIEINHPQRLDVIQQRSTEMTTQNGRLPYKSAGKISDFTFRRGESPVTLILAARPFGANIPGTTIRSKVLVSLEPYGSRRSWCRAPVIISHTNRIGGNP